MSRLLEGIRTRNAVRRIAEYYKRADYLRNAGGKGDPPEEADYHGGRCLGFAYAIAQIRRTDISSEKKEDLLAERRHDVSEDAARAVSSEVRSRGNTLRDLGRIEIHDQDMASDSYRQGMADAIGSSCRALDDMLNYMSFTELVRSLAGRR